MLAPLGVKVGESCGDDAACLRDIGAGQLFGDVQVDEETGLVVDDRGGGLGIGQRRAGGEEGGQTECEHFHDDSLCSGLMGCRRVTWQ
ncbi:hypothetical protein D3C84_1156820 [compost metagenome]